MRGLRRTTAVAAAVACFAALTASSASASTLALSNGTATYTGAASEANHVTISYDFFHGVYLIEDTGVSSISVVPAGYRQPTCHSSSAQLAYCDWGTVTAFVVRLGNGGGFAQSKLTFTPVTFYGGGGDDTLIGGAGSTTLVAAGGTDTLTGGSGSTHFVGGSGNATMTGGSGHNTYQGGSGADTIRSRNGVTEDVSCGDGADSVTADAADTTTADCEAVDRGTGSGTGSSGDQGSGGGTPTTPEPPLPLIASKPVRLAANQVPVGVTCPAAATAGCDGTLALSLPDATTASGKIVAARRVKRVISRPKRFRVQAGKKAVVRVSLSRRGARKFRRAAKGRKSLKVVVTVAIHSDMSTHKTTRTITVRAERRSRGNQKKARGKN